jgi:hypothetical protein
VRARDWKDATQASKRYRFYGLHHPTARICDQARSSIRHVPRRHLVVESSVHIPEFRNRYQLSCCFLDAEYLTLRSVSSLNNPKNNEMKFCENMKLKIGIIIIGYTVNNFTTHITILLVWPCARWTKCERITK